MKNWKQISLIIIIVGGALILILSIIAWRQEAARRNAQVAVQNVEGTLSQERAEADVLLEEIKELRTTMDGMVVPQVELNIRL